MASENIKERKIYRVLIDELNRVWERIYFLTNARSVDADDGENLETKVGAIKGITTSTTVTENGWAADAKMVNESINTLKKSVSDGKSSIASAITAKGVTTAADATYDTMAANIRAIQNSLKRVTIAAGVAKGTHTFNIAQSYPSIYKNLTVNNFAMVNVKGNWYMPTFKASSGGTYNANTTVSESLSYDAQTGILTYNGQESRYNPSGFADCYVRISSADIIMFYV